MGPPRSRDSISFSHTPSQGSGRVRHQRPCLVSDGNGPLCHFRAERTHIPATTATVSCVFPATSFCLNSVTCRSLIKIRRLLAGWFYPILTGKNSQRQRHSLLSSIRAGSDSDTVFAPPRQCLRFVARPAGDRAAVAPPSARCWLDGERTGAAPSRRARGWPPRSCRHGPIGAPRTVCATRR